MVLIYGFRFPTKKKKIMVLGEFRCVTWQIVKCEHRFSLVPNSIA